MPPMAQMSSFEKLKRTTTSGRYLHRQMPLLYSLTVLLSGIFIDYASKYLAILLLQEALPLKLLSGILNLHLVYNAEGFLGLPGQIAGSQTFPLLTIGVATLLLLLILTLVRLNLSRQMHWGLILVVSGGLGNLIDRLVHNGRVTDFVQIAIGPLKSGIFNFADVLILAGSFIVGSRLLTSQDKHN